MLHVCPVWCLLHSATASFSSPFLRTNSRMTAGPWGVSLRDHRGLFALLPQVPELDVVGCIWPLHLAKFGSWFTLRLWLESAPQRPSGETTGRSTVEVHMARWGPFLRSQCWWHKCRHLLEAFVTEAGSGYQHCLAKNAVGSIRSTLLKCHSHFAVETLGRLRSLGEKITGNHSHSSIRNTFCRDYWRLKPLTVM